MFAAARRAGRRLGRRRRARTRGGGALRHRASRVARRACWSAAPRSRSAAKRRATPSLIERCIGARARGACARSRWAASLARLRAHRAQRRETRLLFHAELSQALRSGRRTGCARWSTTASSARSRSRACAMAISTACSPTSASAGMCVAHCRGAARCSTKASTPPTCSRWLFGMPQIVVAQVSDAALGLEVEDLGIAVVPLGVRSGRRDRVELHVRRGRRVDRAVRHAGHAAACPASTSPRATSPATPSCGVYRGDAAERAGRRSRSCRASSSASSISRMRSRSSMRWSRDAPPPITVTDGLNAVPHDRCRRIGLRQAAHAYRFDVERY